MAPRLLLATGSAGKQNELRELLAGCGWELVVPADIGLVLDTPETGRTYAENARIKAVAAALIAGFPALADDSGIEVEAMGGAPAVYSDRFAGPRATEADRRARIFEALRGLSDDERGTRYVCVIAIARPDGSGGTDVSYYEGHCEGRIVPEGEERGDGGFGYDPQFYVPEMGRTMAELTAAEKNRVSHRGRAARAAREALIAMASQRPSE